MFANREQAGNLLAQIILQEYQSFDKMMVVGIARGGVVVAAQVAERLQLPLDFLLVKKLGSPTNPELALGAIGPKQTIYWEEDILQSMQLKRRVLAQMVQQKRKELRLQEAVLRIDRKPQPIKNKMIILVDDGIATGATVLCAYKYLKNEGAKDIILVVPVVGRDMLHTLGKLFTKVYTLTSPVTFRSVGEFYDYFPQVTNEEVIELLSSAR